MTQLGSPRNNPGVFQGVKRRDVRPAALVYQDSLRTLLGWKDAAVGLLVA